MRPKNSYLLGVGSPPFLAVADCNRWKKKKKKKKKHHLQLNFHYEYFPYPTKIPTGRLLFGFYISCVCLFLVFIRDILK